MFWQAALDLYVQQTGHERFRDLCAASHPEHKAWRVEIVRLALGQPQLPRPTTEDRQLQAYMAQHGCGGCG